jgi:hypothetical protein
MKWFITSMLALSFFIGCGEESGPADTPGDGTSEQVPEVVPDADYYLELVDSIGVELGDSNYVFGAISSAKYGPDGNIFVVDLQRSTVLFYSPAGEFIRQVGRSGSGPGEFTLPSDAAFLEDGRFLVANNGARMLSFFDENYEHLYDISDFFPSPPMAMTAVAGSRIVGMKPDWMQNDEGMFMGFTVACWDDSGHVTATYHSSMSPFDPADLSSMMDDLSVFGASPLGRVFTASLSSEEYVITAWSPDAEELFRIERDFDRVPKTQDEIDRETEIANSRMIQNGMPPEMAHWEPDPYRNMVGAIGVDGYDRLWVGRGTVLSPYFDVYDLEGNPLFTAAVDPELDFAYVGVVVCDGGFLAFDPDPEDYPRLYLLELDEAAPLAE